MAQRNNNSFLGGGVSQITGDTSGYYSGGGVPDLFGNNSGGSGFQITGDARGLLGPDIMAGFNALFGGGGIEGVKNPYNCADREPEELDRRAACRDGTLTGEPGVIIPNPYDPCNFGGECISGAQAASYCSKGNNHLQVGCIALYGPGGPDVNDIDPTVTVTPTGACPEGFARNAEGECENREEFRARCQEGGGLVKAATDTGGAGKGGGGRGGASVGPETHLGTCLTNEEAYTWCNQQAADNDPSVPAHPRCAEVISIYESDNGGGGDPPPETTPNGATGISIAGCGEGTVSYDPIYKDPESGIETVLEAVKCAPISEFCTLFSNLCNGDGDIIGVTDSIACPPCGPDEFCNEELGECQTKIDGVLTGSCYDPNRITDEDGNCTTECKAGYSVGLDKFGEFSCISNGNGGSSNEDCSDPDYAAANPEECQNIDLDCAAQNRVTITTGGIGIGSGTTRCGKCSNGYTEDASGNCVQDNNNTNNDDDDDPCDEVDCTDEANANNTCCIGGGSTTFDCASVGKAPLWAGSLPTSEAGCGPCLPTHDTNEDGSCSPKVNGGDNGTDPGIETPTGLGGVTGRMFEKYIPDLDYTPTEILGKAGPFGSLKVEGLLKDYFA